MIRTYGKLVVLAVFFVLAGFVDAGGQKLHEIRLKSRRFVPEVGVREKAKAGRARGRHKIIQFEDRPDEAMLSQLRGLGVKVLNWIPENAVMAHVPADVDVESIVGVRWVGRMSAADKRSKKLERSLERGHVLVDFYPDVDDTRGRAAIVAAGGSVVENAYLLRGTYLVRGDAEVVDRLCEAEDASWVWPASEAIINGEPVVACCGALTSEGAVANYVTYGEGWDGPGLGSVALTYHFENGTDHIAGDLEQDEVVRSFWEWSKHVNISWAETPYANQNRSIDILWATGDHGDGNPFDDGGDETGSVLAHCFYPSPPNSEPIAGDMHFDDYENWNIGSYIDLFSVSLHEIGHGIGLDHSDDTNAVMYAYYQMVTELTQDDIDGVKSLYEENLPNFPYAESFESGLGLWKNSSNDDKDWARFSGITHTSRTGPASAFDGQYYVYLESGNNSASYNKEGVLELLGVELPGALKPVLNFRYSMYGSNIGSLTVEIEDMDSGGSAVLWSLSGDQGSSWYEAEVDLSAYSGKFVNLRIRGKTGGGRRSDMAIDLVELRVEGMVVNGEPAETVGCSNSISWPAMGNADEYEVEYATDELFGQVAGSSGWVAGLSYEFTGLVVGQTYWYRVRARNSISGTESEWSNIVSSTQIAFDGDIDMDCDVDMADMSDFSKQWQAVGCGDCGGADISGDGNVDISDLAGLASNWLLGK